MTKHSVLALADLDRSSLPIAGGKADNLGELIRAGVPVPGGFVLTTHAYRAALSQPVITSKLEALARVDSKDRDRKMGERIEAFFGSPQDIEWAIDKQGHLLIVQSRPITTLYPIPSGPWSHKSPLRVYFSFNVAQGVFQPFTPMGVQFWKAFTGFTADQMGLLESDPLQGAPLWAMGGERLFLDITDVFRNRFGRKLLGENRTG